MSQKKATYLGVASSIFLAIASYFWLFTYQFTYLGIKVKLTAGKWLISDMHHGGQAVSQSFSLGDQILKIDSYSPASNHLLRTWNIVEQASSITVLHNHKITTIVFPHHGTLPSFLALGTLALGMFLLSSLYFRQHCTSKTSRRYYIFLVFTAVFLLAVVPSSMGQSLARFIIIAYVTLLPAFIDIFRRATLLKQRSTTLSLFTLLTVLYATITCLIFFWAQLGNPPALLLSFLSKGIFYIAFGLLILLLILSFVQTNRDNSPQIDLAFLVILSLVPTFLGYLFPLPFDIPFGYSLPLLSLPILAIIKDLILNRLTNFRFYLPKLIFYSLIAAVISGIAVCLYLMADFIPHWILLLYTFLLTAASLPLLKDFFILAQSKQEHLSKLSIFSAVEKERETISTYIHDSTIQNIIYYKRRLETSNRLSKEQVLDSLDDVIFELRELCSNIYPLMIKELGLQAAILEIIAKYQKQEAVLIDGHILTEKLDFGSDVNNFLLRSIKEMINNSILHGHAKQISLVISQDNKQTSFEVIDDGEFIISASDKSDDVQHFGLSLITEKLSPLGGQLNISHNPTRVTIIIPNKE